MRINVRQEGNLNDRPFLYEVKKKLQEKERKRKRESGRKKRG